MCVHIRLSVCLIASLSRGEEKTNALGGPYSHSPPSISPDREFPPQNKTHPSQQQDIATQKHLANYYPVVHVDSGCIQTCIESINNVEISRSNSDRDDPVFF